MELEFDKEIDALLRKGLLDSTAVTRDSAAHLDAEELAAFAENALPDKTKQFYASHLADCVRCRKILAQTITLNLEAEPVTASSDLARSAGDERLPWYRRIVRLPSLAYAMGAFVLLFSGFLGYIAFQSMTGSSALTDVSQVTDTKSAPTSGPSHGEEQYSAMANTSNTAGNAASTAANISTANAVNSASSAVNTSGRGGPSSPEPSPVAAEPKPSDILIDRVAAANEQPAAAAPPAAAKDEERDAQRLAKEEAKADATDAAKRSDDKQMMREKSVSGPAKKQVYGPRGDSRTQQQQTSPMMAGRIENSARVVSGRTFEKKDGVWYDAGYRGQATINVSRGTESYRKLDRGLRTIAESLDGIVVAVWKEKAYRIQ